MKCSELISALKEAMRHEGDIEVVVETRVNNAYVVSKVDDCDFLPEGCYKGCDDATFIIETSTAVKMFWGN